MRDRSAAASRSGVEQVNETVAFALVHRRVHDHRPVDAVRRVEMEIDAEKLLPAELQRRQLPAAACVEDSAAQSFAALQDDGIRLDRSDARAQPQPPFAQPRLHDLVQALGPDRLIGLVDHAPMRREAYLVAPPAGRNQRLDQPLIRRRHVAVEE
jgi:hypothetical protein